MEKTPERPPRPGNAPTVGFGAHQEGSRPMCAWLLKKNTGIGAAVFGKSKYYFTLDYDARMLSWAKKPDMKAEMSLGFRDFVGVDSPTKNASDGAADGGAGEEASDSARPSGRPSSGSSSKSKRSIGSRMRSLSPFRKTECEEYGVVIRTGERSIELTCESKAQADEWFAALRAAMATGGGMSSPVALATQVDFPARSLTSDDISSAATAKGGDMSSPCARAAKVDSPERPLTSDQVSEDEPQEDEHKDVQSFASRTNPSAGSGVRRGCSQSLVMEDLDDGTLATLSTPKRTEQLLSPSESPDRKKSSQCDLAIDAPQKSPKPAKVIEEEVAETRKMYDKRELRRRNRDSFEKQLSAWREKYQDPIKAGPLGLDAQRVRVCVRKRPLFPHEEGEFDVITVRGPELVVHNCLTKADLRSLFIGHMGFHFARAFGENADDCDVYSQCGEPAVQYALQGGSAAIFMFGQTGSGKTHTMQALLNKASEQLFGAGGLNKVYVGAFEIAGKHMKDLQDPENPTKELKVMVDVTFEVAPPGQLEDKASRVATKVHGLKWCSAESAEELLRLCKEAQERRKTRATQSNSVSSRSHSVLRIGRSEGDICLTLVDCAGSERNEDSTHHDAQARKDAADINSTIFTLKECFRVMRSAKGQQPPFRDSLLTRVLADSFTSDNAKVVAIGTVSPAARDTEHSIETLKSLQLLQGTQMSFDKREDVKDETAMIRHPRTWSEEEVRQWLGKAAEGRGEPWVSGLVKGADGKVFVRWPATRFAQLCGGNKELGDLIFKELRQEMQSADQSRRK